VSSWRSFLKDGGHRTLQAIHGAQALDMVEQERPDLVLSDVMMPCWAARNSAAGLRPAF
jgi:CheY-like chemotaxis protein